MQETIAQGLPALLNKIKTKKDIGAYKVKLEKQITAAAVRGNRGGGRGGGRNYGGSYSGQQRQSAAAASQTRPFSKRECSLCKSYGFTLQASTHSVQDCYALKALQRREKRVFAMNINSPVDGTELEGENDTSGHEENTIHENINWLEDGDSSD